MSDVIVARCPRCTGWTMVHGDPNSRTAQEWATYCRRLGDAIETIPLEAARMLRMCSDVSGNPPARDRKCLEVTR